MKIKVSHLAIGLHELAFEETIDSLDIEGKKRFPNPIFIDVKIDKEYANLLFKIRVRTLAHLTCDRCLNEFDLEIGEETQVLFSKEQPAAEYGEQFKYDEDEMRPVLPDMDIIDIAKDVRDALLLAVPMKALCEPDCKGLCPVCGVNLNRETCHHEPEKIDPRWEKLKDLLNSN